MSVWLYIFCIIFHFSIFQIKEFQINISILWIFCQILPEKYHHRSPETSNIIFRTKYHFFDFFLVSRIVSKILVEVFKVYFRIFGWIFEKVNELGTLGLFLLVLREDIFPINSEPFFDFQLFNNKFFFFIHFQLCRLILFS